MQQQAQHQISPEETETLRKARREAFIASLGWKNVVLDPMKSDASFRRYYRVEGAPLKKPVLLMEDPPDRPPVPPFVMVEPFVKIVAHLRALGLNAPEVHFKDIPNGLLILDDFGDDTYTRLLDRGFAAKPLYELAVDALAHLHKDPRRNDIDLPRYDAGHLIDEAMLLLDWYYPRLTGRKPTTEMRESFANVWWGLFKKFPEDQRTLVLRDYHVDNLMLVPDTKGLQSCGLLDFQDALNGQMSYDLMSLLEDARRDVPAGLQKHLYDRYMAAMMGAGFGRDGFDYSFRVLAAQRHAKVLGIFVRLCERDGKARYLRFIPHVHRLFVLSLGNPILKPLDQWFRDHHIDIRSPLK
ncbi:MAG: phosphotransferase [Alphaproteobacteria bacterium]|nr:phosphotransferase [Alphaproteobacteria bacterium]